MTMRIPLFTELILFNLISCVSGLALEGWNTVKNIPLSFSHISTQNILRCEKLCDRQEKCSATTFDNQERICYMHGRYVTTPEKENDTRGRYLYKKYQDKITDPNSGSTCDRNTQIAVPSMQAGHGACHDIEGLVGQNCVSSSDCIVDHSECRSEGTCGCAAGYGFRSGTQTCEGVCATYGDTFQKFIGYHIPYFNQAEFYDKTTKECAQLCVDAIGYTCQSFEMKPSDNNRCTLQAVDASDAGVPYGANTAYIHYQRNCA